MNNPSFDINRWPAVFANVYLCTLPALVIIFLPMLVGGMVEHLGMSAQQSGFVATADMLGYTLGTIASFFFIHRSNWRLLSIACLILMALVNGISGFIGDYHTLLVVRFASGLCGGILTAVLFAAMGQMRDPDSAYGWWLAAQAAFGFVGFQYFWDISVNGGFIVLAVLLLIGLPMVSQVPKSALNPEQQSQQLDKSLVFKAFAGIAAILLVYIGLMAEYTYLERIGNNAGLNPDQIGSAFSAMSIAGLVGGLLAAKLGAKFGRLLPALIGAGGCIASFYLLSAGAMSASDFTFACALYFGLWSFLLPYMVGACAAIDPSGRTLALGNAAIGAGLAFGPFIAASLIGENGYGILAWVAGSFVIVGMLLMLPLLVNRSQATESLATSEA